MKLTLIHSTQPALLGELNKTGLDYQSNNFSNHENHIVNKSNRLSEMEYNLEVLEQAKPKEEGQQRTTDLP